MPLKFYLTFYLKASQHIWWRIFEQRNDYLCSRYSQKGESSQKVRTNCLKSAPMNKSQKLNATKRSWAFNIQCLKRNTIAIHYMNNHNEFFMNRIKILDIWTMMESRESDKKYISSTQPANENSAIYKWVSDTKKGRLL